MGPIAKEGPAPDLEGRVCRLMGERPVEWRSVNRGYTPAERWVVRFEGGLFAFVKVGTSIDTARWLRAEHHMYSWVSAPFMPRLLAWEDGAAPILVLEDLSSARWPPPWSPELIGRVLDTLARVAASPVPEELSDLESLRDRRLAGWTRVVEDPAPFLSLGLCSEGWLAIALPALLRAAGEAELSGDSLLHFDVRSDNLCFSGDRTLLVDWNSACRGNPRVDVAAWLSSLRAEGGPEPWEIMPHEPGLAALLAGYWAARAGLPPTQPGSRVRDVQLAQLQVALPWAAKDLGLRPPDPVGTQQRNGARCGRSLEEGNYHESGGR